MATKTKPASKILAVCNIALAAQKEVSTLADNLGKAKASVVSLLRDAIVKAELVSLSYELVRAEIAPAFPAKDGSKVHLVQIARYAKAIVALSHGFTAGKDDANFTNYINKAQPHGVAQGWWQAGSGGKKTHSAKAEKPSKAVVIGADAAISIVTAGCDTALAEAIKASCEQGDRTWLIQAWTVEKARRAATASSNAASKIKGFTADELAELKKLLAA
jgi:hypothetical protein